MGDAAGLAAVLARVVGDAATRASLIERGARFAAEYVHPVDGALAERLLSAVEDVRTELGAGAGRRP
jgi:predicted ArsR family transcriptional regulator